MKIYSILIITGVESEHQQDRGQSAAMQAASAMLHPLSC